MSLPGSEGATERAAIERLRQSGEQGLPIKKLAPALGVKSQLLRAALGSLERAGLALEIEGRWFAAEHSGLTVGVLEVLENGDALIHPGGRRGTEAALFVPRRYRQGCLDGDRVVAEPVSRRRSRRRWPEMAVVRLLNPAHTQLVGTVEQGDRGRFWLKPFDHRLRLEVELLESEELQSGDAVVAQVERGGSALRHPRGRVVEVLGPVDEPGVDVLMVLRHLAIPEQFPDEVVQAAAALPADPTASDFAGRLDLREEVVVTIDGETARDFDDAVSVKRLEDGGWRLGVHIADVSHYVREGEPLDREAYRRGTSVYFPERAVPMLPKGLSNGLCSLRPDVPRLTLSIFLDFDRTGNRLSHRLAESVIQSHRRLTYTEVRRLLEEPQPGDVEEYGRTLLHLMELQRLAVALNSRRRERGSLDFDLPSGNLVLDEDGTTVGVIAGERNVAHRLIEEMMVAANEAVAYELESKGQPALHRVHPPPAQKDLEQLERVLKRFGIKLRGNLAELPPGSLATVLADLAGKPEAPFLSTLILRSQSQAFYSPEASGHYALAAAEYTHFTSPIRRYPDLIAHRQVKSLLNSKEHNEVGRQRDGEGLASRLPSIGEHASTTERRAERAERDILQWRKVRLLKDRIGERFQARVTGVKNFGVFVQLEEFFVDGLLPIRYLTDDYYKLDEEGLRLVGERTGKTWKMGDSVRVVLVAANERYRSLDLRPASMERRPGREPRPSGRGPKKKRGPRKPPRRRRRR